MASCPITTTERVKLCSIVILLEHSNLIVKIVKYSMLPMLQDDEGEDDDVV